MATGTFQVIMKSIATTGIWPWLQLAAVVIGGKNGAEILHTRIRPFGVRRIGGHGEGIELNARSMALSLR